MSFFSTTSQTAATSNNSRRRAGFVGLAQKLIWTLQTRTTEGVCYEIDARLRPSGNQGLLVSHIETFEAYHARTAAPWERQALLRSRPVAGSQRLASVFEELRSSILRRESPSWVARRDSSESAAAWKPSWPASRANATTSRSGRGGLLDIETAVQCLQLENAVEHPEVIEPQNDRRTNRACSPSLGNPQCPRRPCIRRRLGVSPATVEQASHSREPLDLRSRQREGRSRRRRQTTRLPSPRTKQRSAPGPAERVPEPHFGNP